MTTITREVPSGWVTDADQLLRELNAAEAVAATCESVSVTPLDPPNDDTITMLFDSAPNEAAVDAVISAHPSYTPSAPASIAITSGQWVTLFEDLVAEGEWVEIDTKTILTTGNASTLETHTLYFECMVRRRTGGNVVVCDQGVTKGYGDLPQVKARAVTVGAEKVRIQINVLRTTTLSIQAFDSETVRGTG